MYHRFCERVRGENWKNVLNNSRVFSHDMEIHLSLDMLICLSVSMWDCIHTFDGHCMTIRHWVSANALAPWTIWENHISLPVRNVLTSWCVIQILSSQDHCKWHRLIVLIDTRHLLSQLGKFVIKSITFCYFKYFFLKKNYYP